MPEKKLKPSMREKKRYLLLDGSPSKKEVEKAILDFIGILGYAKSGIEFPRKNIIAINRKEVDKIRAALLLSGNIRVKKVSGSLKKLK
ncbi:MAG: hypothetical protein ABIH72_00900 [archaeon]